MGLSIAASGVALVFMDIELFAEFSGAGFSAKLKEARLLADEANITLKEFKKHIEQFVIFEYYSLKNAGRLGSGYEEVPFIAESLDSFVNNLKLDEVTSIKQSQKEFHIMLLIDKYRGMSSQIVDQSVRDKINEIENYDVKDINFTTAEEITKIIESDNAEVTNLFAEKLSDFENYRLKLNKMFNL